MTAISSRSKPKNQLLEHNVSKVRVSPVPRTRTEPKPVSSDLSSASSSSSSSSIELIRSNVIGQRCLISSPFHDEHELVYADYTASGRSLQFIEDYMTKVVAPTYANTHTEASATGAQTTRLREEARSIIHDAVNAPKDKYVVLFEGSGSTAAIDKLFRVLGFYVSEYTEKKWNLGEKVPEEEKPVVFISSYEHHSNELMWRESPVVRVRVIREGKLIKSHIFNLSEAFYLVSQIPVSTTFNVLYFQEWTVLLTSSIFAMNYTNFQMIMYL